MDKQRLASKQQIARIVQMFASDQLPFTETQAFIAAQTKKEQKAVAPHGRYHLHVTYAPLPRKAELESKFGKDNVSRVFSGPASWHRHSSCTTIDQTPGMREFWIAEVPSHCVGKLIQDVWDDLAACFDSMGFRFAIESEAIELALSKRDLLRQKRIYALGSSVLRGDAHLCVTGLFPHRKQLNGAWVATNLDCNDRLLLVRKTS